MKFNVTLDVPGATVPYPDGVRAVLGPSLASAVRSTSPALLVQHLCCTNDVNGNPRRIWAFYDSATGHIVDAIDEGYTDRPEALREGRAVELPAVHITPGEYREWLDRVEHYRGTWEVAEPGTGWVWKRRYTRERALKFRRTLHDAARKASEVVKVGSREWANVHHNDSDDQVRDRAHAILHGDLAARDASLGVGHVWTNVQCRAYRSYNPEDCTCNA